MFKQIRNILKFRELIFAMLVRGFKAKYKNSFLGIFWSFLNPLANVLIFAFIFTAIIKINIKDYPLYLLCTILPWTFFNSALINSVVSIFEDSHFVKNTPFPLEVIPLAVVIVNLVNFIIDLIILMIILLLLGKGINPLWAYLPFLVFIEFILVCGLSIFLAASYVIFRDLNFILNLVLRLFFYFVPVLYTLEFVPLNLRSFYLLNPLSVIIDSYAKVFLYGAKPDNNLLFLSFIQSVLIFIICYALFNKARKSIPERL
ncbi:ABC transporter permease [bacterium]|nr:MAG: ABC transporter permease [bacterium]